MAVLRKRGLFWYIDLTYQGERQILSTKAQDKATARKILNNIQNQISLGTFNLEQYEKKQIALVEFVRKYLASVAGSRSSGTNRTEKTYLGLFVKEVGDLNLRRIHPEMLAAWRSRYMMDHEASTYNTMRKILHTMFNVAVKWGYVDTNPIKSMPKVKVKEKRFFMTDEEVGAFFNEIDMDIQRTKSTRRKAQLRKLRLFYEFLLHTGLRRSEGIGLKYENVDWPKNVLYVERQKTRICASFRYTNGRRRSSGSSGSGFSMI